MKNPCKMFGSIAGIAFLCSSAARSDDAWAFGRELITHPSAEGKEAFLFTHLPQSQQDYGLPGITYKASRNVTLKAVSLIFDGDPSDISTHYFNVYINTAENFPTNALGGQSFMFDPGQPSTFSAEPWQPDGVATDMLLVTFTFAQPVELGAGHEWVISPAIKLDAFQDAQYLPSMVACQSSSHWNPSGSSGPKTDQYSTQSVTVENGQAVTHNANTPLASQFAADLLINTPTEPQYGQHLLSINTRILELQLMQRLAGLYLSTTLKLHFLTK